jgi:putative membrane protein
MRRWVWALAALAWPCAAAAHPIPGLRDTPPGWTFDPAIVLPVGLAALLYGVGWTRLLRRSVNGRGLLKRQGLLFAAGWLCLAVALVSPLHQAGERAFTAHMIEHELLMLAAAPLLSLSHPLRAMIWAFPTRARQGLGGVGRSGPIQAPWRVLTEPLTATFLQAAALWLWHLPSLFDLALKNGAWHAAQHLAFLVTALLFWSAVIRPGERLGRVVAGLFLTSIVAGALGAFMALSASPWYERYAHLGMTAWGLTPAEDQQLAGLLMWIPGGLVHALAALALLAKALRNPVTVSN